MHTSPQKLELIKTKISKIINEKQLKTKPEIIVVTKTFPFNKILPLIENGHVHFGENKMQEAENKWIEAKSRYSNLKLHMIGSLQTNKVKNAFNFSCIPKIQKKMRNSLFCHKIYQ